MLNTKRDRIKLRKLRNLFPGFPLCFLFGVVLFFLFDPAFAQDNHRDRIYGIDDPMNPDCPCHYRQKIADKEYAQLNGKKKSKTGSTVTIKRKIRFFYKKIKFRMLHNTEVPKIRRIDYSICYKW